ncbi:hypothetical protein ISN45_Aa02g015980, partial [Arabidopsis thaliana x Arabidopsis arenosa]
AFPLPCSCRRHGFSVAMFLPSTWLFRCHVLAVAMAFRLPCLFVISKA